MRFSLTHFTRNPHYVGDALLAVGLPILTASLLTAIAGLIVAIGFVLLPFAEEPWLEARYGTPYVRYKERVPRFVGRGAPAREEIEPI